MSDLNELAGAPSPAPQPTAETQPATPRFDPSSVPFLKSVIEADEPGFTATDEDLKRPELVPVVQNYKQLPEAGLSLYRSKSGGLYAVFNPEVFTGEEIQQFDAKGQLDQVLPPIATLLGGGGAKPGIGEAPPTEAAPAPAASPAPAPVAGSAPPSPQGPLVRARAKASALDLAAPTKKPQPGAGAVSQGLGRPVI